MFYPCNINQQFLSTITYITHNHNCSSKFLSSSRTKIIFITWNIKDYGYTKSQFMFIILLINSSLHYGQRYTSTSHLCTTGQRYSSTSHLCTTGQRYSSVGHVHLNTCSSLHYGQRYSSRNHSSLHYRPKIFSYIII